MLRFPTGLRIAVHDFCEVESMPKHKKPADSGGLFCLFLL